MGANSASSLNSQKNPLGFFALLSSAVCEWFLMFLMFVDAALTYLVVKFAQYCELPTPCILCLRLDHYFGNEKPGYYLSQFCRKHRGEITSLVSCHIHDKLCDVREMCEECFMSIAIHNKSSPESSRFLLGKMGLDGFQSQYNSMIRSSVSGKACSCCSRQWRAKTTAQRLLHLSPVGLGASKASAKPPLPRTPGRSRFNRKDSFKRMRDKFAVTTRRGGTTGVNPLSHVGYTELKITSDSDSEFPMSEDDEGSSVVSKRTDLKEDSAARHSAEIMVKAETSNSSLGKHLNDDSDTMPSLLDQDVQLDESKANEVKSSTPLVGHGLGELEWEQSQMKLNPPTLPELISKDDLPASSNPNDLFSQTSNHNATSEGVSPDVAHPQLNVGEAPIEVSLENSTYVSAPLVPYNVELTNLCSSATHEAKESSSTLAEQVDIHSLKDSAVMDSSTIKSPRASGHPDSSDALAYDGINGLQGPAMLDGNDYGYDSMEGSSVSEIEGESIVERLKRQVEYDRRCISSLHKELEEERNAAAVAANQAMAMITRLQEEKAALHMEALQYLRMMEEQAEYDMEALERANDLVAEKDKEIQDLEYELEFNRNNFPDGLEVENINDASLPFDLKPMKVLEISNKTDFKIPLLDIEDEKLYISQCLKKLEKKLRQVSGEPLSHDMPNGEHSEVPMNGTEHYEELHSDIETQLHHTKGENGLSRQKVLPLTNGCPSPSSIEDNHYVCEETNHVDSEPKKSSVHNGEADLATLENEISDLNDRLEALEADRDFLEHACNHLRNGSEGLQFIQMIAQQLQELRKIGYKRSCLPVQ